MKIVVLSAVLFSIVATVAFAGSATWGINPGSSDWNTAANWTPMTVPNGATDIATFGLSNNTDVTVSAVTTVSNLIFAPAATNSYTITVSAGNSFSNSAGLSLSNVTNDSGTTQTIVTEGAQIDRPSGGLGGFVGFNAGSAGSNITFITNGGAVANSKPGIINFNGNASAGDANFINNPGQATSAQDGQVLFFDSSTAGNGHFNNNGVTTPTGFSGGGCGFFDSSSAGNATFTNFGGFTFFFNTSTAGSGTFVTFSGIINPGRTFFLDDSTGGTGRIEVFGTGQLDISFHNAPGVTIGSVEGTGQVFLGGNNLTVGSNNLNTSLSGVIQDGGSAGGNGGSLTKIGTGSLTLSGANTYTGPTTINAGKLRVDGSITSPVTVNNGGILGGSGSTGSVTVNPGGMVAPGDPATLTVNGDYLQNNGSSLVLAIAGTDPVAYDHLVVTGGITLQAGSILDLDFINGFAPQTGDVFNFLSASSFTGSFSTVNIEGLAPGFEYAFSQTGNAFALTALNNGVSSAPDNASTLLLLAIAALCLLVAKQISFCKAGKPRVSPNYLDF